MMEKILYEQLLERNERETLPYLPVHKSNATLLNQLDGITAKCELLEREIQQLERSILDGSGGGDGGTTGGGSGSGSSGKDISKTQAILLKNETKLREKLEKLQDEYNAKLKEYNEEQSNVIEITKELSTLKDTNMNNVEKLKKYEEVEIPTLVKQTEYYQSEMEEYSSRTQLAEQQYMGLKETIRTLTEENDKLTKENDMLQNRLVSEKEKVSDEMNVLTEMVDKLKREVDMLREYKSQQQQRDKQQSKQGGGGGLFGLISKVHLSPDKSSSAEDNTNTTNTGRQFATTGVVIPSQPKHIIQAHNSEGLCVRYDDTGTDLVVTSGADGLVKVWDTGMGALRATLRGPAAGHSVTGCDISHGLVVGAGSDKTCRVWNLRTERMIHHLVGHAHKITAVRLFHNPHNAVITASADRSIKVWDISRQTYRQTTTLRHSSTCNTIDVDSAAGTVATGHLDGGLRFWDVRTSERTLDIPRIHESSISSVQFNPTSNYQVVTNSTDSSMKVIDLRTSMPIQTYRHPEFQTSYSYSSCSYSPNGQYVAAGSSSTGNLFIWDVNDGTLKKRIVKPQPDDDNNITITAPNRGSGIGVCGFAWCKSNNTSGQQVATIDRKGQLVLWA